MGEVLLVVYVLGVVFAYLQFKEAGKNDPGISAALWPIALFAAVTKSGGVPASEEATPAPPPTPIGTTEDTIDVEPVPPPPPPSQRGKGEPPPQPRF